MTLKERIEFGKEVIKAIHTTKRKLVDTDIVAILKHSKPTDISQLKKMGLKFTRLGSGAFRTAYHNLEADVVIKFPSKCEEADCDDECLESGIDHSCTEIRSIKAILKDKESLPLHRYMPKILYYSKATGIIMTHFYEVRGYDKKTSEIVQIIEDLAYDLGYSNNDIHPWNVGMDEDGQYKILDCGILSKDDY